MSPQPQWTMGQEEVLDERTWREDDDDAVVAASSCLTFAVRGKQPFVAVGAQH